MFYNQFKIFLTEAPDLFKTKENLGDKIVSRLSQDHSGNKGKFEENKITFETVFQYALDIDPDPRKKFTLWILQKYASGGIRFLEDFDRVHRALKVFIDARNHHNLEGRDQNINNFKGLSDLEALVNKLTDNDMHLSDEDKLLKELQASGDIDIKYVGNIGYVLILKSHKASCALYSKLAWCTADNDTSGYFNQYHGQGPLVVLSDNKLKKKFQFHRESNQYLDEHDNHISVEVLTKINDKLMNISRKLLGFERKKYFYVTINENIFNIDDYIKDEDLLIWVIKKDDNYNYHVLLNSDEYIKIFDKIKNPPETVQKAVLENFPPLFFKHLNIINDKLQKEIINNRDYHSYINDHFSEKNKIYAIKNIDYKIILQLNNPSEEIQRITIDTVLKGIDKHLNINIDDNHVFSVYYNTFNTLILYKTELVTVLNYLNNNDNYNNDIYINGFKVYKEIISKLNNLRKIRNK